MNILQMITQFIGSLHITEHDILFLLIGVIVGMMIMRGGNVGRRAYGMYRRYRGNY